MCNIPRIGRTLDGAGSADNEGNPKPATTGTQKPQRAVATPQSQPASRMLEMQPNRQMDPKKRRKRRCIQKSWCPWTAAKRRRWA